MNENSFIAPTSFSLEDTVSLSVYDSENIEIGTINVEDGKINFFRFAENKNRQYTSVEDFQSIIDENGLHFGKTSEKRWIKYNPNPKHHNTGDCTLRAYCKALDIDWNTAYDMAVKKGKELALIPDDVRIVEAILTDNGFTHSKLRKGEPKKTVNEFAVEHPTGTYVLDLRAHVVTIINGRYYDSWDSGDKKIKGYYTK